MQSEFISLAGLVLCLLLLALPLCVFYRLDRRLLRRMLVALGRFAVVLLLTGFYLHFLFRQNSLWFDLLWLLLMIPAAAVLSAKRTHFVLPMIGGMAAASLLVGGIVLLLAWRGTSAFDTRWFVPVMGYMVGCMAVTCRAGLHAYANARRGYGRMYEYLMGNGARRMEALMPFLRKAASVAFLPGVVRISTLGLVGLPGLFCGLLMGGLCPVDSILLLLLLTMASLAASVLSLAVAVWLLERRVK
jgi:putative ABC transport system permease protein